MPELLEIEMYRRAADATVGRTITALSAPDDWYLKDVDDRTLRSVFVGAQIEGTNRRGKLLLVHTTSATMGLRFGMTGRLVIDGEPVIAALEYSATRLDPAWDRFAIEFEGGATLTMNDPRRLGGVELDPDLSRLGPDAWSVSTEWLVELCGRYRVAIKALLLDQKRVAGLGNLLADELLWRAGIDPNRPANSLAVQEVELLGAELRPMLDELFERGGSNGGDAFDSRTDGAQCPLDGEPMRHGTVGGRSTWWCSGHQR